MQRELEAAKSALVKSQENLALQTELMDDLVATAAATAATAAAATAAIAGIATAVGARLLELIAVAGCKVASEPTAAVDEQQLLQLEQQTARIKVPSKCVAQSECPLGAGAGGAAECNRGRCI